LADRRQQPTGTVGPTKISVLVALFIASGLFGFAIVPIAVQVNGTAPQIQWTAVGALVVIAGVLFVFAFTTYRTVHRERRLMDPRRAVNFLILAKASALAGSMVAGGYLGFALQFVDDLDIVLPRERFVRGLVASVTGVIIVISALLLERACRVPKDEDE
jgi:Protein of unknown function (DUF3180)